MSNKNTKSAPLKMKLYKVLQRSGSGTHHGGYQSGFDYTPYLPTGDGKPGKWMSIPKNRSIDTCVRGFHVTKNPHGWGAGKPHARVFLVEVEGEYVPDARYDGNHKICCRKIRLVQEVMESPSKKNTWIPKPPPKLYTQEEVDKVVRDLKGKVSQSMQAFQNEILKTIDAVYPPH